MINIEDFKKIEIKIGKILSAEKIEGSSKLLKLEIDFGSEKRIIAAGIAAFYEPESLIGKQIPVLTNLEPRELMGIESMGMVLAASNEGKPVLLSPMENVALGSIVK